MRKLLRHLGLIIFPALCLSALYLPTLCRAEPIMETSCLNIQSIGADSFSLVVPNTANAGKLSLQKMFLSNPSRAVADLVGLKCSVARTVNLAESSPITSIRLGSHTDRVRIVFELKAATKRNLSYSLSGATITVKIGQAAADESDSVTSAAEMQHDATAEKVKVAEKPAKKIEEKPVTKPVEMLGSKNGESYEIVDNVIKEKKPAAALKAKDLPAQSGVPQFRDSGTVEPSPEALTGEVPVKIESGNTTTTIEAKETKDSISPPNAGGTDVSAIYFQLTKSGNAPAAVIDLSAVVPYILTKKREDLYELEIDNAHLAGRHMLLPQFPPDNFTGFSAIIAQELGGKVTIQIFIEEGMQLLPFTAEGKLWVRIAKK